MGERLAPFRELHVDRLSQIPGVSAIVAAAIVSELGVDMTRFPTVGHLISWAGLCPSNDESAGKRRSSRLRKGAPWLKTLLVQSAWAATRAKGTYLQSQFLRLKPRRGPKKAVVAVAASILELLADLYSPEAYYRRSTAVVERLGARAHKGQLHKKDVAIALRSLFTLGVQSPRRALFWPLLARALPRGTHVIRAAIACAIRGEHMIRYIEEVVQSRLDTALAEIDAELEVDALLAATGVTKAGRRSLPVYSPVDAREPVPTTH